MIIKTLTLHNFMSYADVSVDLSSVTVACLSGQNGSGKSALLDAITWALWEEGRSSSDELIRLGEKEMWVDLVFEYEGRTYRVRRSRLKRATKGGMRGTSRGLLDLQLLSPVSERVKSGTTDDGRESAPVGALVRGSAESTVSGVSLSGNGRGQTGAAGTAITSHPSLEESDGEHLGHWRSLTGPSMRVTQQSICDLLRMDYDTFVNSAYLRQGRADEFTTRPPSERKHVLSEILGLAYFDRLQEACRLRARDAKTRMDMIESSLLTLPQLQSERDQVSAEHELRTNEFVSKDQQLKQLETNVGVLSESVQQLKLMRQKIEHDSAQLKELNSDVANLTVQKLELERRSKELTELVERSSEIKQKSEELDRLKTDIEILDQKALQAQGLIEEKLKVQSGLASIRSRLEVELDHLKASSESCRVRLDALKYDTKDSDKIQESYAEFKKLLQSESELALKQDMFTRLTERAAQLQSMINESKIKLEVELGQKELTLSELDSVLAAESLIAEQKQALEADVKELERVESEFDLVEDKGLMLKSELESVDARIDEIKRRQDENREKVRELTEHSHESICPLCAAPIVDRSAVISRYHTDNEALDDDILSQLKLRGELEEERNELRLRYARLKRELGRRKELDKRIGQFNEKEETMARARDSRARVITDILALGRRLDEMDFAQIERESLINVKTEIHKLEFDPAVYASLQSQIRAKRHIEARHIQLKRDQAELQKLEVELPLALEKESRCIEELESESYGEEHRTELKALKERIDFLNYDRDHHQMMKTELIALLPFIEQVRDLKKALEDLPAIEESLSKVRGMLEIKLAKIPELEQELKQLQDQTSELNEKQFHLEQSQEQLDRLREEHRALAREVAILESRKLQVEKELEALAEKKKELVQLTDEREDHLFLAESFGKKGIQAVIIENAVPEIETEANRILARLSDNKMHIGLVTQQKTKSGTLSETLDILIGDEIGTRNYELYSGGEAFKVNFAIRIALSRLLARRAGARLETLVIDEGFGSQDDLSRERLVSSIKSIQSDFRKILVITHIADVREMFPVQIYVQKESGVSRLQVIS
ncbi:SMC family ATPase [Candidatus Obscuribacterales bacterium]|nr:SMC family ATPase [Candidatus Obscuribacterales bacterium]